MNQVRLLSDNTKEYVDEYYHILETMIEEMRGAKITDSISGTFINQMIPHHSAAISMSKNILKYTTNMEIQNLSKDIIEKQTRQIAKMKEMYDTCSGVVNNNRDIDLYIRSYNLYFENMIHGMERSCTGNNLDIDFLTEMIPHHEGAINMASNLLRFGICEKLKAIGENIVEDESAQLEQMKVLLKNMTLRNRY